MQAMAMAAMLVLSLLTIAGTGAAAATPGKVSAHLTKSSFTAPQAGSVKLIYAFSPTSKHWGYVLSRKQGVTWATLRSVKKTGSFHGSYSLTVKQLFGAKAVKVGQYRVKISADANSVTRSFTVLRTSSGGMPEAGAWHSTGLSGPYGGGTVTVTSVQFVVASDRTDVSGFGFGYTYSAPINPKVPGGCSGSGFSGIASASVTSPITSGRFSTPGSTGAWTGAGSGIFEGTFDSPTRAHGTAKFSLFISGPGCFMSQTASTGTFSWMASR